MSACACLCMLFVCVMLSVFVINSSCGCGEHLGSFGPGAAAGPACAEPALPPSCALSLAAAVKGNACVPCPSIWWPGGRRPCSRTRTRTEAAEGVRQRL